MKLFIKLNVFILFMSFLTGCFPLEASVSFAAMLPTGSPTSTNGFSLDFSESTATPFQPIPPTDIITPTDTPIPTETPLPTITPTPTDTPTITPTLTPTEFTLEGYEDQEPPEGQMNILLIGVDKRPGQKQYRTDTLILVTINSKNNSTNVTSFPRDMWIEIPGHGMDRINTAYVYGKMELLAQTFKHNFGVKIDHYIMINFKNFKRIVTGLEPLEVKVAESVSDYRAGKYVTIPKGMVTMDADDALWYVRTRKSTNDFARNRRQQEVLSAMFHKLLSLEALRYAPELFDFYKNNVETDLKWVDIVPWIPFGIRFVNSPKINQYYIGPQMVYNSITPGGAMVLVPYMDQVMKVIRQSQNMK